MPMKHIDLLSGGVFLLNWCSFLVLCAAAPTCPSGILWPGVTGDTNSGYGQATYYTTPNGGACGYGSSIPANIAAVSSRLWGNGAACGSCYEISCCGSDFLRSACKGGSVTIQVTDLCPDAGNPICVNQPHFDLGTAAFNTIGNSLAGVLKIQYKKVSCPPSSTVTVQVKGSSQWYLQVVFSKLNDSLAKARVKSSQGNVAGQWLSMPLAWGAAYQWSAGSSGKYLQGDLSFELSSVKGKVIILTNCLPSGQWSAGGQRSCAPNF